MMLGFRKIWGSLLNLLVMGYLARTLDQSDFGLVAAAFVLINWINTLNASGIDDFLILHHQKDSQKITSAAFSLTFWTGILSLLILIPVSQGWAAFYQNPLLQPMLWMMGGTFFFNLLCLVPKALLRKNMNYKSMLKLQVCVGTVEGILKIYGAWAGWGAYSLILPGLIMAPITWLGYLYYSKFKIPALKWYLAEWRMIWKFTAFVMGSRLLTKLMNEGDNLIVGKMFGMEALGIYNIAFQSAGFLVGIITGISGDVTTPVFGKTIAQPERFRDMVQKLLALLSMIAVPICITLALNAEEIIHLLYGLNFSDAAPLLSMLAVFSIFRMLNSPSSNIYNALHQPEKPFYFQLAGVPLFLLSLYLSAPYGLLFFTATVCVYRILYSTFMLSRALSAIETATGRTLRKIMPFFLASAPGTLLVVLSGFYIRPTEPTTTAFYAMLKVVVSLLVYIFSLRLLFRKSWEESGLQLLQAHPSFKKIPGIGLLLPKPLV